MICPNLDLGSVPNRDAFARFWRDVITYYADLLPKANGTANGEEGSYPTYPFQANYIKSLERLANNFGDDPDPDAYCEYLRILREARRRVSNSLDEIDLEAEPNESPSGFNCNDILPNPATAPPPPRKLTNPQGGLPVSIAGPDPSGVNLNLFRNNVRSLRPAPRIDGLAPAGGLTNAHENTAEMVELYWMALLRDLPFRRWTLPNPTQGLENIPNDWQQLIATGATLGNAVSDLNRVNEYFAEPYPVGGGGVTAQNIFRGAARGDEAGPYISQFLLRGNTVRCARGRDYRNHPRDGVIPEGSVPNMQTQATVVPYVDFLRNKREWRCVEQGFVDPSGTDALECAGGRFIRNLRDLANWVHLDDPAQHFRNAALLMLNEPPLAPPPPDKKSGKAKGARADAAVRGQTPLDSFAFEAADKSAGRRDQCRPTGRPFPFAACNPYVPDKPDARTQIGFVTFGPEHVLDAIGEVTDLALRAAWWQKWFVHRRLRPEEFGGLVDAWWPQGGRPYQIDPLLREFGLLFRLVKMRNAFIDDAGSGGTVPGGETYLLPQVYPEGSPTHPSYPSGHATIAGACATLLKAFFDVERAMTCPAAPLDPPDPTRLPPAFVASDDGRALLRAAENDLPGAQPLTVEGELNKLASNIAVGRNAAGVHWRSDATQGMELGEAVTTYFLYEQAWALNEEAFCFTFRRFFRPERVTITRRTAYRPGVEERTVTWSVQTFDAKTGKAVGEAEELERARIVECP